MITLIIVYSNMKSVLEITENSTQCFGFLQPSLGLELLHKNTGYLYRSKSINYTSNS